MRPYDPVEEAIRIATAGGAGCAFANGVPTKALPNGQVPAPGTTFRNPLQHHPKADVPIFSSLFTQSDGCLYLPQTYLASTPTNLPAVDVSPEAALVAGDGEEHDGGVESAETEPVPLKGDGEGL